MGEIFCVEFQREQTFEIPLKISYKFAVSV